MLFFFFSFAKHNTTLNRVWGSASLCWSFLNERGNYLDLCHLLSVVWAADREADLIFPLKQSSSSLCRRTTLVSVLFAPFRGKTLTRLTAIWHSCCPKPDKYGLCLLSRFCDFCDAADKRSRVQFSNNALQQMCVRAQLFSTHMSAYQHKKRFIFITV